MPWINKNKLVDQSKKNQNSFIKYSIIINIKNTNYQKLD